MNPTVIVLLNALAIGALAWLTISLRVRNALAVDPNRRERAVIRNVLTGAARVLGPGTYYLTGEEELLERVSANEDPVDRLGDEADHVRTAGNIELTVEYSYSLRIRRRANPTDLDDRGMNEEELFNKYALITVMRIDTPGDRIKRAQRDVSTVMDHGPFGELWVDQITQTAQNPVFIGSPPDERVLPSDLAHPLVAPAGTDRTLESRAQLYAFISRIIEQRVNALLGDVATGIGMEIINFRIRDIRYKNPDVQKRAEKLHEMRHLTKAIAQIRAERPMLSEREATVIALGQDARFSDVSMTVINAMVQEEWQGIARQAGPTTQSVLTAILGKILAKI